MISNMVFSQELLFEIDLKTGNKIPFNWLKYHCDTARLIVSIPEKITSNSGLLILPGGGYSKLSTENEGKNIAEWANKIGIVAFILKYRQIGRAHV